jgi:hypothetical protein
LIVTSNLQQFNSAESHSSPTKRVQPGSLLVELGYNLQLQKEDDAKIYCDRSVGFDSEKPNEFGIASSFEKKVLDYAALQSTYQITSDLTI